MRRFFSRFLNLFRRAPAESEMSREIHSHLALLQEDFERRGLPPAEAALAARRAYGGVEQAKELHRETRSLVVIEQFFKDLRYSWLNLLRNPGFTLTAVAALALGIGVNATIFGIYNAVALKQLPVADPSHVVRLAQASGRYGFNFPEYRYLQEHSEFFEGLTASSQSIPVAASTGSDAPLERLRGYAVSSGYFSVLGVRARLGRTFLSEPDSASAVVVLDHRYWQRRFNSNPNVLGQTIRLNSKPYTIIGVAPPEFLGTDVYSSETAFWAPLSMLDQLDPDVGSGWRDERGDANAAEFQLMARLKSGLPPGQAQAQATALIQRFREAHGEPTRGAVVAFERASNFGVAASFFFDLFAGAVLMTVSLVLFVACANVANMLLARGVMRQREIGIRLALGAGRGRVIRQLLTESVLLSLFGGVVGILLASQASKVIWVAAVSYVQGLRGLRLDLDVSPDAHVLLYGLVLSVATGLLFGLVPALQLTRPDLHSASKADAPAFGGRRSRLRGLLLGLQVTVSVFLLVVSGWMVGDLKSSFAKDSDLGFESRDRYTLTLSGKNAAALPRILQRLASLPEVSSTAVGSTPLFPSAEAAVEAGSAHWSVPLSYASDRYFETLGISLLRGRGFSSQEADQGSPVAVVTAATAQRLWPNEDPLGRRLHIDFLKSADYVVIGVAKDVRFSAITQLDSLRVFLPSGALKTRIARLIGGLVHVRGNHDKAVAAIEAAVESVDPDLLRNLDIVSLDRGQLALQRGFFRVLGLFAATLTTLSLLLAAIGIYGVMAFLVSRRTREIGIRVTLGASSRMILQSVVRQGLWPVLIGTLAGIVMAAGLLAIRPVREIIQFSSSASLFRATFGDPLFYAELALVALIAALASILPARRALRVDPAVSLRYE